MATATVSGGDVILPVEPTAHADDTAVGDDNSHRVQNERERKRKRKRRAEMVRRKLKTLNNIVFCVAFLEWAGNAIGTLAFLWATVVLLGGFCSLLSRMDFWIATVMIFVEGSRVFIRNDASVNQWLFGSTSAFRWEYLSSRRISGLSMIGNTIAVIIGVGIALTPVAFLPEIAAGVLKVVLLVIISQLLTRLRERWFAYIVLLLFLVAAVCGGFYGFIKEESHNMKRSKGVRSKLKLVGFYIAWVAGTHLVANLLTLPVSLCIQFSHSHPLLQLCTKAVLASGLACLPFLQAIKLVSHYRYASISVAIVLLKLSNHETRRRDFGQELDYSSESSEEQDNSSCSLSVEILDTILPILFFWSVMFPLPGISLEMSFFMLISVIVAVVIANLQIPVAFLQVLLSILRLRSLIGHHHHDYRPLPPDASPNLVPSIVVFFMMELCQGSSYILAVILGLISFFRRRSLVRVLKFEKKWGATALNLYFRQAYQARTEKGLFPSEKSRPPSLDSFAIKSLGCTSSHEMQIIGLRILDNSLKQGDSKSNKKVITEIVKDAKNIIPNIMELICYLTEKDSSGYKNQEKVVCSCLRLLFFGRVTDVDSNDKQKEKKEVARLCLNFVRRLAIEGGKISTIFRQELSENPFFLDSLEHILNLKGCKDELWKPVMDIIATLALDGAARHDIGSTQAIIDKLIHLFLGQDDVNHRENNNDRSLRMAAGEALANLTIKSTDNCWAILLADPKHNLIKKLADMLKNESYICVAANILHNLCANCRERLIDLGANVHLESALTDVMKLITTNKGKKLEAALSLASQIGYRKYFADILESDINAAILVEKLVNILKSNKPHLQYPRIRRVLVEVIKSIVELCPGYIEIFREQGALDALNIIKGTPSRLEKYRAFLGGEGVVEESLPMHDLVEKAKGLINQATPTPAV